jgi:PAS domain S-box-containing protein
MEDITSLKKQIENLKIENEELKSDKNIVRITLKEQEDYQESQIRFRTIFEHSRLGNKLISKDLKITQLNPAMVALLGYENKEEIIGTRILDYAPAEFHHDWKKLQIKLWELKTPSFTLETCLKKKDGSTIWCNVTSILFKDQGETFGYTIIEDISEQKTLRLQKEQSEIFQVTLNTQEEERRRISESLHNGLGQLLYGTKLSIDYLTVKLAVENPKQFQTSKEYAAKLLTDSINNVRRISHELIPSILIDFGLEAAIKDICNQLQSGGIHFDCKVSVGDVKLDNFVELAVFRTAQELMLNIVKHAKATQANVKVQVAGSDVIIAVRDNGQGIEATRHNKPGIGLSSIRNKIDLLKGSLTIESAPEKGTFIEVRLPHQIHDKL